MHRSAPSRGVFFFGSRCRSLPPSGGAAGTPRWWQWANVIAILIFGAMSWLAASEGANAQGLILTSTPSGITETGQVYRQVNVASGDGPAISIRSLAVRCQLAPPSTSQASSGAL